MSGPYVDHVRRRRYVFALHNPSVADAHVDDPTLRKCVGFASRWESAGGLPLLSLHDPSVLRDADISPPYRWTLTRWWPRENVDVVIVNPFAYRATDPRDLKRAAKSGVDVVGASNVHWLNAVFDGATMLVVGWGKLAVGGATAERGVGNLLELAARYRLTPMCLGTNADGSPQHPLYLPYDRKLRPWSPPGGAR